MGCLEDIVTALWTRLWKSQGFFPVMRFFSFPQCLDRLWGPSSLSCYMFLCLGFLAIIWNVWKTQFTLVPKQLIVTAFFLVVCKCGKCPVITCSVLKVLYSEYTEIFLNIVYFSFHSYFLNPLVLWIFLLSVKRKFWNHSSVLGIHRI